MKKVFITGATGFIGKRLVSKLNKKYEIICLIRKNSDINSISHLQINFVKGDLLDEKSYEKELKGIDTVIHLATSHTKSKNFSDLNNSKKLIKLSKEKKVKKFIFLSSMATKRKILDKYGENKLKIEQILKKSKINYSIIRPSIIYDENNLSLIEKNLKIFPFFIPIIGSGKYKLDPIFIEDVINSISKSIENKKTNKKEYDLSGGEKISYNEIIEICKEKFKIKKIPIHIPIKLALIIFKIFPIASIESIKGIEEDTNSDISKIKKDLKLNPIKFREGINYVNI